MEELRWLAGLVARIQRVSTKGVSGISAELGTLFNCFSTTRARVYMRSLLLLFGRQL